MTIINDNYRVVNKLEASLTDDARVIIYDRHMFIVQATELNKIVFKHLKISFSCSINTLAYLPQA
jgi:hypothetical protein